jgi:hypothetical protein
LAIYVHLYPELPWVYSKIFNPNPNFLLQNLDKGWTWEFLTSNMPINFILKHKQYFKLNFLNENRGLTVDIIKQNSEIKWNYKTISKYINLSEIINHPEVKWDYKYMSGNKSLTTDFVLEHINKKWKLKSLLFNESVDINKILINKSKDLNELIEEALFDIHVKFNIKRMIFVPELFSEVSIEDKFHVYSVMKGLTIELLLQYKNEKWDWKELSKNSSFTIGDIEKGITLGLPFQIPFVTGNPNCTFDFILRYKEDIIKYLNYISLREKNILQTDACYNKFSPEYNKYILKKKLALRNADILIPDLDNIVLEY